MEFFKFRGVYLLLAGFTAGSIAQAGTISFSGIGASGTINPNSLPWTVTANDQTVNPALRGVPVWGLPGIGGGSATWPGSVDPLVSFSITFSDLLSGVTIDQTPDPTPTLGDDFTRFHSNGDTQIWTPTYSGGLTVTFTAPSGYSLPAGATFYANIAFTGGVVVGTKFTGTFTTDPVPEPASGSVAGLALLGVALRALRRHAS